VGGGGVVGAEQGKLQNKIPQSMGQSGPNGKRKVGGRGMGGPGFNLTTQGGNTGLKEQGDKGGGRQNEMRATTKTDRLIKVLTANAVQHAVDQVKRGKNRMGVREGVL